MIFGAVLAGGVGSRMNIANMPKQFLDLHGKPILIHTLDKFRNVEELDEIYVGVHPEWQEHTQELLNTFFPDETRFHIVAGGADRNETIMNVIHRIESEHGESEEHYIITHDSVRPFVTEDMIRDNIHAVQKYKACDTAVAAVDTIFVSKDSEVIQSIPERKYLYQGQTPQSFQMSLLKSLYEDLSPEEKEMLTDACKICVVRDVPVHIVPGDVSNLKITTMGDYGIAQAMCERDDDNG